MFKKCFSLMIIALLAISCVPAVNAGEVGLWISEYNDDFDYCGNSYNYMRIWKTTLEFADGWKYDVVYPDTWDHVGNSPYCIEETDYELTFKDNEGIYFRYPDLRQDPTNESKLIKTPQPVKATLFIRVLRQTDKLNDGWCKYHRELTAEITMPVGTNHWINGVSKTQGGTGMYFRNAKTYTGSDRMDWIRCYDDDKEVFFMPGGQYHKPETWEVGYPHGQDWTVGRK
ncbi:MAG: hypothetical protein LBR15_03735 [Methanobrevibacter sp.]|jgi:hypothetical protein|nr:hypothetical protein [Candidatus Methanovirga australis]